MLPSDPARGVRRPALPAGYGSGFETGSVPLDKFLQATFGMVRGLDAQGVQVFGLLALVHKTACGNAGADAFLTLP